MARQNRTRQLVVNIEESFYEQISELCSKQGISCSTLGRRLLIKHLISVGVLPQEIALEVLL